MLTSGMQRNSRRIEDILSWVEAFTLFTTVLTYFFPRHWRDLTEYVLVILRTYRQFAGRVWLSYHQPFRGHAATTNLTDWSSLNVQLFNFHAVETSARQAPGQGIHESSEAVASLGIEASPPLPTPPASMSTCALAVLETTGHLLVRVTRSRSPYAALVLPLVLATS